MEDSERGKIRNRTFAQQIRNFSGLRFGKITPTDIDAFMDMGGQTFIFMESKHGGKPLPYGQRLALERLVDACQRAGIDSLLLILSHDTAEDIDFAQCRVVRYRYMQEWIEQAEPVTAFDACDGFIKAMQMRRDEAHQKQWAERFLALVP